MTTLDRILAELTFYSKPDILKEQYREDFDFTKINSEALDKYQKILTNIKWSQQKILKYPVYFSDFYAESIPKDEALEHHIHAYIEDLNILRNKLHYFLGSLGNDIQKIAINREEIKEAFQFIKDEIYRVFNDVSNVRNPHNHAGDRLVDGDLVDVRLAGVILAEGFPFKDNFRPEFLDELRERERNSFDKAKARWIEMSENNAEQTSGLVEDTISSNKGFLYQYLDIRTLDFLDSQRDENGN